MKIIPLLEKFEINGEAIKVVSGWELDFKTFSFRNSLKKEIGRVFVRIKRGWNQTHISIAPEYQGKGYGMNMLRYVAKSMDYIVINKNRVVNSDIYKVIKKMREFEDLEIFEDDMGDTVISSGKLDKKTIIDKLKV